MDYEKHGYSRMISKILLTSCKSPKDVFERFCDYTLCQIATAFVIGRLEPRFYLESSAVTTTLWDTDVISYSPGLPT